jgi:hypothetical protein
MLSTVSPSFDNRAEAPTETALRRLQGIGEVLSSLDVTRLRSPQEATRALWTLDAANKCIRAVLADVRAEPATEQLISKSERLIGLIELARTEVAGPHAR